MTLQVALTGWYVGFFIAFAIIFVIVALVAVILQLAQRIAAQNRDVAAALARIRANTSAMPDVGAINHDAQRMNLRLATMRDQLAGSDVGNRGQT